MHNLRTWRLGAATAVLVTVVGCSSTPPAPDAGTLIGQAEAALGSVDLKTLTVSGRGPGGTFGQAWQPGMAWPALNYSVLTRAMNFQTAALREEFGRSRAEPQGGGAVPLMGGGEQKATGFLRETWAWNGSAAAAAAAPVAVAGRQHDLWLSTPHGALKAARRHGAVAGSRGEGSAALATLSFTIPGQLAATLVLDGSRRVTRIESTMPHPVLGDTAVLTEFSDYRPVAGRGLEFPMRIRQSQGASPVLDLAVAEVRVDEPVDIAVPEAVRHARENVVVTQVADGVWYLAGGSHHSVAIEQSAQIVLVESPLHDGRALAVMAAANQLVPGKRVQTVINSHHHFDHAGGLRAAAAEGAHLITSALAKPYFERVFANPNRIAPDRLAQTGAPVRITGISGSTVLRDGSRAVEIHEMQGSLHAVGFLMVWLPAEKLLIQADAYTPGPPGSPPPPAPNANHLNLVQNIERLGLRPQTLLPLHGRVVPMAELLAQIGR